MVSERVERICLREQSISRCRGRSVSGTHTASCQTCCLAVACPCAASLLYHNIMHLRTFHLFCLGDYWNVKIIDKVHFSMLMKNIQDFLTFCNISVTYETGWKLEECSGFKNGSKWPPILKTSMITIVLHYVFNY